MTEWDHCDACGWVMEANGQCTNESCVNFPQEDVGVTTHSQKRLEIGPIQMPNHRQRRIMARQKRVSAAEERQRKLRREAEERERKKHARARTKAQRIARKKSGKR